MSATQKKTFYIPPEKLIPMVERLQRDEADAIEEIYEVFYPKIFGHILKHVSDFTVAKSLTNDVFIEIQKKKHMIKNPVAFVGWVNRIVVAKYNTYLRQKYAEKKRIEKAHRAKPKKIYKRRKWKDSEKNILITKLDQLPAKQAEVMKLHYIDEKTVEEISTLINVPIGTVKSRLYYGRMSFQTLLFGGTSVQNN